MKYFDLEEVETPRKDEQKVVVESENDATVEAKRVREFHRYVRNVCMFLVVEKLSDFLTINRNSSHIGWLVYVLLIGEVKRTLWSNLGDSIPAENEKAILLSHLTGNKYRVDSADDQLNDPRLITQKPLIDLKYLNTVVSLCNLLFNSNVASNQ